jgi:hypothetical protein
MTSFCSILSGITVTQVSGSDKRFTVNVVGLINTNRYTIETFPPISAVNDEGNPSIVNGLNTYRFTRVATTPSNTVQLNIKITSSGATVNTSYLTWTQFKGFSTSAMTSIRAGADNTDMIVDLIKVFTQPITFRISNVYNETLRVVNTGGTPRVIITSIDAGSNTQTPTNANTSLTFNTTIPSQAIARGENYLLMGLTTLNGVPSYILAEPFVFTTTFTYEQVTLIDKLFANVFAGGTLIIDGGSVV